MKLNREKSLIYPKSKKSKYNEVKKDINEMVIFRRVIIWIIFL